VRLQTYLAARLFDVHLREWDELLFNLEQRRSYDENVGKKKAGKARNQGYRKYICSWADKIKICSGKRLDHISESREDHIK
jgi:hypothetical protein